ncbi:MAG: hypothetical protein PUK66_07215 [Bacteroidales bacterium]|uniref:hypothetical protein n=1 Tax=Porphyromonas sp. TaxID=1924944 RepID=UPI002971D294|nr:hypothetical protein [Porphyromonas sp.]MDD7438601.1 hypothetical protein [Bacteroidales bacterium]MDY3067857.1 hypothetical protein [Porphyromonas sp.]
MKEIVAKLTTNIDLLGTELEADNVEVFLVRIKGKTYWECLDKMALLDSQVVAVSVYGKDVRIISPNDAYDLVMSGKVVLGKVLSVAEFDGHVGEFLQRSLNV